MAAVATRLGHHVTSHVRYIVCHVQYFTETHLLIKYGFCCLFLLPVL